MINPFSDLPVIVQCTRLFRERFMRSEYNSSGDPINVFEEIDTKIEVMDCLYDNSWGLLDIPVLGMEPFGSMLYWY